MNEAADAGKHLIVRPMHAADVQLTIDWAAQEGWNPGLHDARCFRAADPGGFFIGELQGESRGESRGELRGELSAETRGESREELSGDPRGERQRARRAEPVGSISAVAYGTRFGFIGLYIVRPEFRGRGFGYRIWQHGMRYLGERNIGLDGVVAQQANYAKSGFRLAYRNIRFQGTAPAQPGAPREHNAPIRLTEVPRSLLDAYDRTLFPAPRASFLDAWLAQPDAVALASIAAGRLCGYGVLRTCRAGRKIGPLFADDAPTAQRLFDALLAHCPGETVALDVPEPNAAAIALAERHGMTSVFETARMYTKETPDVELAKVFGVTTFELG
jgi:ribosomal protein S18 acetylase RimI-like enzyme